MMRTKQRHIYDKRFENSYEQTMQINKNVSQINETQRNVIWFCLGVECINRRVCLCFKWWFVHLHFCWCCLFANGITFIIIIWSFACDNCSMYTILLSLFFCFYLRRDLCFFFSFCRSRAFPFTFYRTFIQFLSFSSSVSDVKNSISRNQSDEKENKKHHNKTMCFFVGFIIWLQRKSRVHSFAMSMNRQCTNMCCSPRFKINIMGISKIWDEIFHSNKLKPFLFCFIAALAFEC